jgi:hypothetical protein
MLWDTTAMFSKSWCWFKSLFKSDDAYYVENARDIHELEWRLTQMRRNGLPNPRYKYYLGY